MATESETEPSVTSPYERPDDRVGVAGGQIFAAIVPDSVATVILQFSASRQDPARTLTSRAVNNVVVLKIPPRTAHADFPSTIIRRAANGHVISTTT